MIDAPPPSLVAACRTVVKDRQLDRGHYQAQIDKAVAEFSKAPQREMPVQHRFQEGVYIREIFMPADTFVIGAKHRFRHINIVLTGLAKVMMDGVMHDIKAGDVFESGECVQKILYIVEDMRWVTVHANPTNERNVAKLEEMIAEFDPKLLAEKGSRTLDEFRMSLTRSLTQ